MSSLRKVILETLENYNLRNTYSDPETFGSYSLLEALTPDGEDISFGKAEINDLCDTLWDNLKEIEEENTRLKELNQELVEALKQCKAYMDEHSPQNEVTNDILADAQVATAKAEDGDGERMKCIDCKYAKELIPEQEHYVYFIAQYMKK